jgi:AcrR family transcriptional regulator
MKSNETGSKEDLRVRRTHKLLWEALMAELTERTFEEITVRDICERAMVHRTTFYKHYEDKYALLEQGMRQMYDALVTQWHAPAPTPAPAPSNLRALPGNHHPPAYFIGLFEHVAQHQQFYKLMLGGEGVNRFQKLLKNYITEVAGVRVQELIPTNQHLPVPPGMHVQFFAGAVLSLLAWWLENDMPLTPHQMAEYLLSRHNILTDLDISK